MIAVCADNKHGKTEKTDIYVKPVKKNLFVAKFFSAGLLRFAGWWSIFAGVLAVNSVCPFCGSAACPVGLGTTGVIAVFFAAVKQWGKLFYQLMYRCVFQIYRKNNSSTKDADSNA